MEEFGRVRQPAAASSMNKSTTPLGHRTRRRPTTTLVSSARILFALLAAETIADHFRQLPASSSPSPSPPSRQLRPPAGFPGLILAAAEECESDEDCKSEKVCHEKKCICGRDHPIEDQDRCLPQALIGEGCSLDEQCMGSSQCLAGQCSCGVDAIALFNPSAKIYYCHEKRRLNEECNHDSQCPSNSFCSTIKYGCLCQNGFGPTTVSNGGVESLECLPKVCQESSSCESEYHQCDEGKCKCLATHFDPTTAKCYKFGSTGGKHLDDLVAGGSNATATTGADGKRHSIEDDLIRSIFKDLTETSDRIWLVLIVLTLLTILIFLLAYVLLRKYCLAYCWRAQKKEYEPNSKSSHLKNGQNFNKNSINNKSFRQKSSGYDIEDNCGHRNDNDENHDDDDDDDDSAAFANKPHDSRDRSAFMSSPSNHVKVDVGRDTRRLNQQSAHSVVAPLASSTSTPV